MMKPAIGKFHCMACPPANCASPTVIGVEVCFVKQTAQKIHAKFA